MAKGVNRMTILGNLGKDPEVKTTASGKKVATLTIATTESWKNSEGERVEETEWHRVIIWGRKAEVAEQYLRKGREVYIEGKKKTRNYEADGQTKYITEIIAHDMQLIGGRPPQTPEDVNTYHNQQPANYDDIPI